MLNLDFTLSRGGGAGGALGTYICVGCRVEGTGGVGLVPVLLVVVVVVGAGDDERGRSNGLRRLVDLPTTCLYPSRLPLRRRPPSGVSTTSAGS
jgi:hypothetical protein